MNILVDMNLSPTWVDFLISAGFEACHWSKVGSPDAHDETVMKWAVDHGHVLLTSDLDFGAILAATRQKRPSVLLLRSDALIHQTVGGIVLAAIRQAERELTDGALISIESTRARLRIFIAPVRLAQPNGSIRKLTEWPSHRSELVPILLELDGSDALNRPLC